MLEKLKQIRGLLPTNGTSVSKGKFYEDRALAFLHGHGLKEIQQNFHTRFGEIDIIAQDGDTLVFIEVRYRKSQHHGTALESVQFYKQRKIIKSAQLFLQKNGLTNKMPCRFDVIGITGKHEPLDIRWIRNAF